MAVSKVAYDGHTLIDLTQDTAVESDVADGKYFHKSNGERVQGTSGKVIVQGSDSSAFLIRPTAGETLAPLDCDRKSVLKKLGNTVAVNQLVPSLSNWSGQNASISVDDDGVASLTATGAGEYIGLAISTSIPAVLANRYYLFKAAVKTSNGTSISMQYGNVFSYKGPTANSWTFIQDIKTSASPSGAYIQIRIYGTFAVGDVVQVKDVEVRNLDIHFGSTNRIPSDLLSHPENWGRYYAGSLNHNAGTLDSADGTVLRSIGRNIFDKSQYQNLVTDYDLIDSSYAVKAIDVIPNQKYCVYWNSGTYAASPILLINKYSHVNEAGFADLRNASGQKFFDVGSEGKIFIGVNTATATDAVYNARIEECNLTISLYYEGESGYDQYYPYSVLAEVDTGSEVLRSAGAVADEKTPDGTITRRVGVVDLGTINWSYDSGNDYMNSPAGTPPGAKAQLSGMPNAHLGAEYTLVASNELGNSTGKCYTLWNGRVFVKGSGYTSASAFKTAMSGVYLYYELATPTTEQGTAFTGLQKVDGHGIEMVTGGTTGIPVPFTAQYLKTINAAPTDTIVITENGSHDVAMYDGAIVNVSGGGSLNLQSKNLALNAAAPPTYVRPDNTYNGLSYVRVHTEDINPAWIRSGARVCGVPGSYEGATFNRSVGINIDVVDGTFQLSLSISYRAPDSGSVVWDTMIPEEHEEDGYYNYTADLDLCTGTPMDGFYLTESSGFTLDQYSIDHLTYLEVYHSGNTRTWYFFVPSNASTYSITFTP